MVCVCGSRRVPALTGANALLWLVPRKDDRGSAAEGTGSSGFVQVFRQVLAAPSRRGGREGWPWKGAGDPEKEKPKKPLIKNLFPSGGAAVRCRLARQGW